MNRNTSSFYSKKLIIYYLKIKTYSIYKYFMEEKISQLQQICYKLDIIQFKQYCITNNFKNLKKKLIDFNNFENLKLGFEEDDIDDLIELFNVLVMGNYKNLMELANKNNINLLEDKDVIYFIKHYNIYTNFVVEI